MFIWLILGIKLINNKYILSEEFPNVAIYFLNRWFCFIKSNYFSISSKIYLPLALQPLLSCIIFVEIKCFNSPCTQFFSKPNKYKKVIVYALTAIFCGVINQSNPISMMLSICLIVKNSFTRFSFFDV